MGAVFLFGVLEEISWGPRVFDVETPDFFIENNIQREINLHNMEIYGWSLNRVIFSQTLALALVFYFFAIPLAYQRRESVRRWIGRIGLPVRVFVTC